MLLKNKQTRKYFIHTPTVHKKALKVETPFIDF